MKLIRKAGIISEIWQVFVRDSSSTTGAGLTGLTSGSSGLTAYYHRDTDTTATAISLVTMTVGGYTSGGFAEIDSTNMPGWYQFCPPNAALARGARSCAFHLKGATNMAPLPIEVDLDAGTEIASQVWTDQATGTGTGAGSDFDASGSIGYKLLNSLSVGTVATALGGQAKTDAASAVWRDNTTGGDFAVVGSVGLLVVTDLDTNIGSRSTLTAAQAATAVWEDHTLGTGTGAGGDFDVANTIGYRLANFLGTGVVVTSLASQAKTDVASAVWQDNTTGGDFGVTGSVGLLVVTDLDTNIGSRLASASYTAPLNLTAAQIATGVWEDHVLGTGTGAGGDFDVLNTIGYQLANFLGTAPSTTNIASAVWDLRTTGHTSSTTFGATVVAAGSAGDPWTTSLPGAYGAGTAGFIVGTNLDAKVSLVSAPTAAQVAAAVWTDHVVGTGTGAGGDFDVAGTIGYQLANHINTAQAAPSLGSQAKTDVENAVWNAFGSAHTTAGTMGYNVGTTVPTISTNIGTLYSTIVAYTSQVNDAAATTTSFKTLLIQADGFWNDATLVFTSGALSGESRVILSYVQANGAVTFDEPLTSAPSNGDNFSIRVGHTHTKSQIAQSVWTDHVVGTGTGAGGDFDVTASIGYRLANYTGAAQTALAVDPTGAPLATAGSLSTVSTTIGTPANVTIAADIASVKTDTGTTLPALLPSSPVKNTAFTYVIKMVLASDHVTPATGLTVAMTRSLDGAAFASATGTVTEISTGHYKVAASAADMNGDFVAHRFTAGTADDLTVEMVTVS